jgi:hypothetical protein
MSFAIQTQTVNLSTNTATFDFGQTVYQYVIGISFVQMAYSTNFADDNAVENMSVHLAPNLTGSTVQVTATLVLHDDDSHNLDTSNSYLKLTCLAMLGSNDLNGNLTNITNIASGGNSAVLSEPLNPDLLVGVLSGFDYSYGSSDHFVETFSASAGVNTVQGGVVLTGSAQMNDDSGNNATCTIDGGLIAYAGVSGSNLLFQTVTKQSPANNVTVNFNQPITGAGAFVQGWTISYGDDDHKVAQWWAGPYEVKFDASSGAVTLVRLAATVGDDSGNREDDSKSSVTVLVVATT